MNIKKYFLMLKNFFSSNIKLLWELSTCSCKKINNEWMIHNGLFLFKLLFIQFINLVRKFFLHIFNDTISSEIINQEILFDTICNNT
ncbi:hypothetical protein BpHYR1_045250 [Brachionus plicatilis]|uniref:Uncharacterized protein n=1 Tax=Brachionus plicatilis TaxID=10195 RepID=A0A3M7SGH1_BRAPC|nr:hypothetical protein BpHYR1_045250 [Brachionus plicatilis]